MPLKREKHRLQVRRAAGLLVGVLLTACGGDGGVSATFITTPTPTPGGMPTPTPAASAYAVSALVSDGSVPAVTIDRDLINPWGIVFAPGSPVWVANNATGTATLYDGTALSNQPVTTLFIAAGIANEAGGLYGRIDLAARGGFSGAPGLPTDFRPPTVRLSNPAGPHAMVSGIVATVTDNVGVVSVEFFAGPFSIGIATAPPFFVDWDSTTVANGDVRLTAQARDAAGNVGTSEPVDVTVSNLPSPP